MRKKRIKRAIILCIAAAIMLCIGMFLKHYKYIIREKNDYLNRLTDHQVRYIALGFDDFRESDFSMVLPLMKQYDARCTFNRIARDTTLSDDEIDYMKWIIKSRCEIGDHTWMHCNFIYNDPLFNGQDPANPEGNQEPFPTNEQLRTDYGNGKNAFGYALDEAVNETLVPWYDYNNKWEALGCTWKELSDEECQLIRDTFSIIKDETGLLATLDELSNTYLGTEGSSRGSYNEEKGCYTGGIFTDCKTSANHEIWERILEVTNLFYKDQYKSDFSLFTWSWPGPEPTPFVFEKDGSYYYDEECTKLYNYLAKMESSLYTDEAGNPKNRSFDEVLEEYGYKITHDNFYPSRGDGQNRVMMSRQLIYNASLSRKNAIVYSTDRTVDYEAISTEFEDDFFDDTSGKSEAAQMYDAKGAFYDFIENTRQDTSNGLVHGEVLDSIDTDSERRFLKQLLEYCDKTGIQVVSKKEAYEYCFEHTKEKGNLIYNPRFRNTAEEFLKDSECVPSNPDGYTGDCHVEQHLFRNCLVTDGTTYYTHYGIPLGNITYSAKIKGTGTVKIYAIQNKDSVDFSEDEYELLTELNVDGSGFSTYSGTFFIEDYPETEYEQICAGLGDKIMGIKIVYSEGLTIKDIKLEKQK